MRALLIYFMAMHAVDLCFLFVFEFLDEMIRLTVRYIAQMSKFFSYL